MCPNSNVHRPRSRVANTDVRGSGRRARVGDLVRRIGLVASRAIHEVFVAVLWRGALLAISLSLVQGVQARDAKDTIQRVKPSIVAVGTFERTRSPAFAFSGTGFAVGDGGLVATNAHVLPKSLDGERRETIAVAVSTNSGQLQVYPANVVAQDLSNDTAILSIVGGRFPPLPLGDFQRLREGQELYFTGFPIGTVLGLIPATHRTIVAALTPLAIPQPDAAQLDARSIRRLSQPVPQVIQLDAIAYPGNSGSPVYDPESGEVMGILNSVFVKSTRESALSTPSGIAFAVPVSVVISLLARQR